MNPHQIQTAALARYQRTGRGRPHFSQVAGLSTHARVYDALGGTDNTDVAQTDLVVVPGLGCASWMYRRLARSLSRWRNVWVYDPPGHGFSQGRLGFPAGIEQLTDHLAQWLKVNGLRGVPVLGHSMGGEVILDLAARYPDLVGPLIACAPTGIPENPHVSAQFIRLLMDLPRERFQLWPWGLCAYLRCGLARMYAIANDQDKHETGPLLPNIHTPLLVIDGTADPVIRSWTLEVMTQRVTGARGVQVMGGTHALTDSHPVEVAMHTLDFLSDLAKK